MSQKNKLDPRAKRSRQWMRAALLELINEKGYEKTSITDITDRAGLSRPTFYLHYKSKEEILMDQLEILLDPITEEFYQFKFNSENDHPGSYSVIKTFECILEHIEIFRLVIQTDAEYLLLEKMAQNNLVYLEDLAHRCKRKINQDILNLSAQLMAGAFIAIFANWIQDGCTNSPEIIGEFYTEAIRPFLRAAICKGELDYIFT